ncbi:MAG: sugar O-acetyltransferase [Alphaproteobacteria bacterium]
MEQKKRMIAGLPYKSWFGVLPKERTRNKKLIYKYNNCCPDNKKKIDKLIRKILGKTGEKVHIEAPFYCDYGYNIEVGEEFYANYNCTILDVAKVRIGNNVMFAPNVSIYTAGHPIHPEARNSGYEYGIEVVIGDNVWLGGGVIINPGVTIGDNVVIGSGSVVTKNIPSNVIAAGNPCKVIREITDEDKHYYYKDRKFDVSDYCSN